MTADLLTALGALADEWTQATCQTDGAPCSWHRVSAECAAELRQTIAAHQSERTDTAEACVPFLLGALQDAVNRAREDRAAQPSEPERGTAVEPRAYRLSERDARLKAWLGNVKPGDQVTVGLNSTDTLTGKVYEADDARGRSLCVWTTILRHGNGYPGGDYEPLDHKPAAKYGAGVERS